MRALLGETFRLLAAHLNLFTLISLTVWLPGHVLSNYFEFFEPAPAEPSQSVRTIFAIAVVFEPLVVAATLVALARIKSGLPVGYAIAMSQGLAAWGRLLVVRFVINLTALPALGVLFAAPAGGLGAMVVGVCLIALAVALLVRFAVIDAVVVLEGRNAITVWRRAAALTAGRRWRIFWTAVTILVTIVLPAALAEWALYRWPELNHFVVRVLVGCVVAVIQSSLLTIALFLFYWQARGIEGLSSAAGVRATS